jgi:hypothetical protein
MRTAPVGMGEFQEILQRNEGSIERRRRPRFSTRLSCRVSPASKERTAFSGTVIDISRSGVLVRLDSEQVSRVLKPDGVVRVVIDLPRNPEFSPRCLECIATVVRIVAAEAHTEVAFEIERMRAKEQDAKATSKSDWLGSAIEGPIQ